MGVWEVFSKRRKKVDRAGQPDVYQYDKLSDQFRNQVIHILRSTIGPYMQMPQPSWDTVEEPASNQAWRLIFNQFTRELGVFVLGKNEHEPPDMQCFNYFINTGTEQALDLMELAFNVIDRRVREWTSYQQRNARSEQGADSAIDELNYRFKDHAIGYQFQSGQLVRLDSEFIHGEMVQPALALLTQEDFRGASAEFLRAHEHYRKGRPKEAIAEALKAFESTMKTICDLKRWTYPRNATAVPLIEVVMKNGLVPAEMASHFGGLRSAMESGLPTIRNKQGGHGQGQDVKEVPDYMAAHALHLCAANIVFLVQAYKATLR